MKKGYIEMGLTIWVMSVIGIFSIIYVSQGILQTSIQIPISVPITICILGVVVYKYITYSKNKEQKK